MSDKNNELITSVTLVNNKLRFSGTAGNNPAISIDYIAPLGDDEGYTSLELLLLSLSSCVGSAILTFLRRMNKTIMGCTINSHGIRHIEHPTGFRSIDLDIKLNSPDTNSDDMRKVIALAEDKYCPVYAMIKGNTKVNISFSISN